MAWQTVATTNLESYGKVHLQYDDSSSGTSRTARLRFELNAGASIYVYIDNLSLDGNNVRGRFTCDGTMDFWTGSLENGTRTFTFSCPWYSGTKSYSVSGYIPSGVTAPSGLSVSLNSKTYNSASIKASISSYGVPSSTDGRYIEAAILNQNSYGASYRYAIARNTTSSTITVNNSSNANPSSFNIEGNHKYWYGMYASNTQASASKVGGEFYTPCPPLATLAYVSQEYSAYNKVNARISYTRQADGGAQTRTGYYRYSTDGGTNYSAWTSFGAISVAAGAIGYFTANLPTSSSIRLQAKITTPNGGDSAVKTITFSTLATHQAPNFSNFEYVDSNPDTVNLTGDNQTMIQGQSTPLITISTANKATSNDGIDVTNYSAILTSRSNTVEYSSDSAVTISLGAPTESGTSNLTVSAIDRLSTSKAVSKQILIYPWAKPTIAASIARINNFESQSKINASGVYSPVLVDGVARNTLVFQYRTKKSSSSSWGSWISRPVVINGNNWSVAEFSVTLDNEYQWDVEARISDSFDNAVASLSVSIGIPIFRIGTDGYVYNNEKKLITVDEAPKYSTHVGQVIMSTTLDTAAKVQAIYGGTWVAWGAGRVPVGVNTSDTDFNTVNKTGGSKTVTLNLNQIPKHQHSLTNHVLSHGITDGWNVVQGQGDYWGSDNGKIKTTEVGGGQAHDNLQPYITAYMWRRTA